MKFEPAISAYKMTRAKTRGAGDGGRLQGIKMALAMFALTNGCQPWYCRLAWWVAIHGTPGLPDAKARIKEPPPWGEG